MGAILVSVKMSQQQQKQQQQQRRRCRQEMLAQSENRRRMIQCKLLAERKWRQHNLKPWSLKLEVELQFFLGGCVSTKRGNPEMGLGLCARKGLRKRCLWGRSHGRSEDEQACRAQTKFVSYRIYIASSKAEPATCVLGHQVGWHKELLEEIKDCERSEEKKIAEAGLTCFWMVVQRFSV